MNNMTIKTGFVAKKASWVIDEISNGFIITKETTFSHYSHSYYENDIEKIFNIIRDQLNQKKEQNKL